MEIELVEQAGGQVLLHGARAAGDGDIVGAGGLARLIQGRLDSAGDEGEVGSALHRQRVTRVVAEDEDRNAERGLLAPGA